MEFLTQFDQKTIEWKRIPKKDQSKFEFALKHHVMTFKRFD